MIIQLYNLILLNMTSAHQLLNQFTERYCYPETEKNNVFSGYSFFCLLEMLQRGAVQSQDSESRGIFNEILNVIQNNEYLSLLDPDQSVTMNNLLCHKDKLSLTPYYADYAERNNIIIEKINVQKIHESIQLINAMVAQLTNNLIPSILNSNDYDETFVFTLMNILNFEGQWLEVFPVEDTQEENFITVQEGKRVETKVMMMKQCNEYYSYYEDDVNQYILMSCKDSFNCMLVCLPKKNTEQFTSYDIEYIISRMEWEKISQFNLPRFEIETEIDLEELCKSLGMYTMFTRSDQLKQIIDDNDLMLSSIRQKCVIKVNEEGARSSVATFAEVMAGCCPPSFINKEPINFVADHPFSFKLIDMRQMLVLFAGVFFNK